jgi:chemotaxis protein methyltransferase CheR
MRGAPERDQSPAGIQRVAMSDQEFGRYSRFIEAELGIKMPPAKKIMLEARLQKRLKILGLASFGQYYDHVFGTGGAKGDDSELVNLMDAVTTNKTDFFRESSHFDYLAGTAVPELLRTSEAGTRRELAVWSAGCSTGEEPYTIAMVLADFAERHAGFRFSVLGTDISTRVLDAARTAIYEEEKAAPVPPEMKKGYLTRSKDRARRQVRVAPGLRGFVRFQRVNLMDPRYGLEGTMDVVFCRNVIIYFDRATQESMVGKLARCLRPGGYLFMGHSETLMGMDVPLRGAAPTVYRKTE